MRWWHSTRDVAAVPGRRSPGFLEEPVDGSGSDPLATILAAHEVVRSEKAQMGGSQQFCH